MTNTNSPIKAGLKRFFSLLLILTSLATWAIPSFALRQTELEQSPLQSRQLSDTLSGMEEDLEGVPLIPSQLPGLILEVLHRIAKQARPGVATILLTVTLPDAVLWIKADRAQAEERDPDFEGKRPELVQVLREAGVNFRKRSLWVPTELGEVHMEVTTAEFGTTESVLETENVSGLALTPYDEGELIRSVPSPWKWGVGGETIQVYIVRMASLYQSLKAVRKTRLSIRYGGQEIWAILRAGEEAPVRFLLRDLFDALGDLCGKIAFDWVDLESSSVQDDDSGRKVSIVLRSPLSGAGMEEKFSSFKQFKREHLKEVAASDRAAGRLKPGAPQFFGDALLHDVKALKLLLDLTRLHPRWLNSYWSQVQDWMNQDIDRLRQDHLAHFRSKEGWRVVSWNQQGHDIHRTDAFYAPAPNPDISSEFVDCFGNTLLPGDPQLLAEQGFVHELLRATGPKRRFCIVFPTATYLSQRAGMRFLKDQALGRYLYFMEADTRSGSQASQLIWPARQEADRQARSQAAQRPPSSGNIPLPAAGPLVSDEFLERNLLGLSVGGRSPSREIIRWRWRSLQDQIPLERAVEFLAPRIRQLRDETRNFLRPAEPILSHPPFVDESDPLTLVSEVRYGLRDRSLRGLSSDGIDALADGFVQVIDPHEPLSPPGPLVLAVQFLLTLIQEAQEKGESREDQEIAGSLWDSVFRPPEQTESAGMEEVQAKLRVYVESWLSTQNVHGGQARFASYGRSRPNSTPGRDIGRDRWELVLALKRNGQDNPERIRAEFMRLLDELRIRIPDQEKKWIEEAARGAFMSAGMEENKTGRVGFVMDAGIGLLMPAKLDPQTRFLVIAEGIEQVTVLVNQGIASDRLLVLVADEREKKQVAESLRIPEANIFKLEDFKNNVTTARRYVWDVARSRLRVWDGAQEVFVLETPQAGNLRELLARLRGIIPSDWQERRQMTNDDLAQVLRLYELGV